ncbi:MAG: molybdenum cofactor biosynthesis protein MoaE [Chloroflexi bacterium]|nr:molybdenum cofactor biosynthesis protein MoaE [Chloroflexota bacterium]
MEVSVRLFAALREAAGASTVSVIVVEGIDVKELLQQVQLQHPLLADRCVGTVVAVNEEYAEPTTRVRPGDTVALIPPVSGGAVTEGLSVRVTNDTLDVPHIIQVLRKHTNGAVITFEGVVRNHNHGRTVLFLEYEAYADMAERVLRRIGEETREEFAIDDIALWHRIGRLEIGETSLVVAVASPHRREAFRACSEAVEKVKALVPVWKREVWEGGTEWLGKGS